MTLTPCGMPLTHSAPASRSVSMCVESVSRRGAPRARGANLELLARVADATDACIVASGGVNSLADIAALRRLGIEGAIVGKALYQGAFTLSQALAVAGDEEHQ